MKYKESRKYSGKQFIHSYGEIKLSVNAGTASGAAEIIDKRIAEVIEKIFHDKEDFFPRPKAVVIDDSTVAVGLRFPVGV